MVAHPVIGVVGNPNCGKTTMFNLLTGGKQTVGNWPARCHRREKGRSVPLQRPTLHAGRSSRRLLAQSGLGKC
ncbi:MULTISPECIES: FeoB small GTPase domain-containing protein [Symbiopectobacterium]|uniref:FeoB small GTPase domain-containing protein n=1 Tax=Symbiopectobacterium TaxID=801 RepID=UPI00257C4AB8|nr:FeoB small GTPase domain-containing protein [Candidatus Symbiopectobacterium endolongispinus]